MDRPPNDDFRNQLLYFLFGLVSRLIWPILEKIFFKKKRTGVKKKEGSG